MPCLSADRRHGGGVRPRPGRRRSGGGRVGRAGRPGRRGGRAGSFRPALPRRSAARSRAGLRAGGSRLHGSRSTTMATLAPRRWRWARARTPRSCVLTGGAPCTTGEFVTLARPRARRQGREHRCEPRPPAQVLVHQAAAPSRCRRDPARLAAAQLRLAVYRPGRDLFVNRQGQGGSPAAGGARRVSDLMNWITA